MTEACNVSPVTYDMPAWGDAQIKRYLFRHGLFVRRGLSADAAERMGDRLARRDHERDDRRVCLECSSLQRGNTCFRKQPVLTSILQRCPSFEFQTP